MNTIPFASSYPHRKLDGSRRASRYPQTPATASVEVLDIRRLPKVSNHDLFEDFCRPYRSPTEVQFPLSVSKTTPNTPSRRSRAQSSVGLFALNYDIGGWSRPPSPNLNASGRSQARLSGSRVLGTGALAFPSTNALPPLHLDQPGPHRQRVKSTSSNARRSVSSSYGSLYVDETMPPLPPLPSRTPGAPHITPARVMPPEYSSRPTLPKAQKAKDLMSFDLVPTSSEKRRRKKSGGIDRRRRTPSAKDDKLPPLRLSKTDSGCFSIEALSSSLEQSISPRQTFSKPLVPFAHHDAPLSASLETGFSQARSTARSRRSSSYAVNDRHTDPFVGGLYRGDSSRSSFGW